NSQFAHERSVPKITELGMETEHGCRKDAIRNTISAMTLGKDVSVLFPDILKNMATSDLDQKKLVYLDLMYSPSNTLKRQKVSLLNHCVGIMQRHIRSCAFLPSTPLFKFVLLETPIIAFDYQP